MIFNVQILGSGAALPTLKRNPSAQYINCNDRHILIDCGEGTQHQFRKFGIKFQKIKHILISHLHGDHYFGLMGLLSTMNLLGRDKDVNLYAPKELKEIIDIQLKASGHHYDFNIHFHELHFKEKTKIFEDKLIEIYCFPLNHRIITYGFEIREKQKPFHINGELFKEKGISLMAIPYFREGKDFYDENLKKTFFATEFTFPPDKVKSYAYCSDNAILESQLEFFETCDVIYHEATFIDKHIDRAIATKHSTASQVAKLVSKTKAKLLVLGHLSSRYDNTELHLKEAKVYFEKTIFAEDGLIFNL